MGLSMIMVRRQRLILSSERPKTGSRLVHRYPLLGVSWLGLTKHSIGVRYQIIYDHDHQSNCEDFLQAYQTSQTPGHLK